MLVKWVTTSYVLVEGHFELCEIDGLVTGLLALVENSVFFWGVYNGQQWHS